MSPLLNEWNNNYKMYRRMKFTLKVWSFYENIPQNEGPFIILQKFILVSCYFLNFTNIKYFCLYFWVMHGKDSTAVAHLGWTKVCFRICFWKICLWKWCFVIFGVLIFPTLEWLLEKTVWHRNFKPSGQVSF